MLPVLLDLSQRRVVVFGGGRVALRKARYFAREAEVVVVSPRFVRGFADLAVRKVRRRVRNPTTYLRGATIVVPATDDQGLNRRIATEARRRRIWVDRIDGPGDVAVPSVVRRGPVVVAIATGGRAPILARFLRRQFEARMGPDVGTMAVLLGRARQRLMDTVEVRAQRERILRRLVEDRILWSLVRRHDLGGARRRIAATIQRAVESEV